eukprot:163893-Hanusia_phi.AAC.2
MIYDATRGEEMKVARYDGPDERCRRPSRTRLRLSSSRTHSSVRSSSSARCARRPHKDFRTSEATIASAKTHL